MPGRYFSSGTGYAWGFNGKENDNEVSGSGNQYDYGFRIYNPRLGKFLSVDPLSISFPWWSPYHFAGNSTIWAVDLDGLEYKIVVFRYTEGKDKPEITVKIFSDIVFDAETKQPESKNSKEYQLAKAEVFIYYNNELVILSAVYEPCTYPSGLKASANYDYTSSESMKKLGKDNFTYLKEQFPALINATKQIYDRDGIAPEDPNKEFRDILETSIYVYPYLKHLPVKGISYKKLIESTKEGPAKFYTRDQKEIARMTEEAWKGRIQSIKNNNFKYYKF